MRSDDRLEPVGAGSVRDTQRRHAKPNVARDRSRATRSLGLGLLPVLQRLRAGLNPFEVGVNAARGARRVRFLRGDFLPPGLLLRPPFLALPLALPLLL